MRSMVEGAAAARPSIRQRSFIAARPLHRASARSPSAQRGRMSVSDLAARHRARVCQPPRARKKTEGGGAPKGACHPLSALQSATLLLPTSPRTRANGARSPSGASPRTRHASRNQHWLSPRPCFLGPGSGGCHPPSPVPVQRAPRRPVFLPDQRCPGPPGSGVQIRARAPHPAPRSGMPREHDPRMSGILLLVLEMETNVNGKETALHRVIAGLTRIPAEPGAISGIDRDVSRISFTQSVTPALSSGFICVP